MNGYLRVCAARGERPSSMAAWIGVHRLTIEYNYLKLKAGQHPCQARSDCMHAEICAISSDSAPPEAISKPNTPLGE